MRFPTHTRIGLLIISLTFLPLSGCFDLGLGDSLGIKSPDAEYRNLSVQSLSLEQIGFDLGFDLSNPNSFDIPVATLDWNLDLFQQPFTFGEIRFEDPEPGAANYTADGGILTFLGIQTLPANGTLDLQTPFNVALLDTFEGIIRIASGEDVPYTIGGTIHFQCAFGQWDLPFGYSGTWSNQEMIGVLETAGGSILEDILF